MIFYLRETEVKIGGVTFRYPDFEIRFNIPFDDDPEPNIGEIQIYNLSRSTISKIKKGYPVTLNSGYHDYLGHVLTGTVSEANSKWEGVDKITTIKVGDSADAWGSTPFKKAYKAGTAAKQIITDLAKAMGLRLAEINLPKNPVYKRGRTLNAAAQKLLREIAIKDCGAKLYITNGALYIRPPSVGNKTAFVLNAATGLVGTPSIIEKEVNGKKTIAYEVVGLLNHMLQVDNVIRVESSVITGFYRIKKAAFISDGSQHVTKMEVVPA